MFPTPKLCKGIDYQKVYDPSEDSFLLLDAIETDLSSLEVAYPLCLEIGSGSGIVTTFLGQILVQRYGKLAYLLTTDINLYANQVTIQTGNLNQVRIDTLNTNLVSGLKQDVKFDIICFNPPYVPTTPTEFTTSLQPDQLLYNTWAGGKLGRNVTDQVLVRLPTLLSNQGRAYLVFIQQNLPHTIIKEIAPKLGLKAEIVLERKAGIERLYILKLQLDLSKE